MDFRQAVRIWRTRWILTSVLLVLAVAGGAAAATKMPRHYQSASSVVLLASHAASAQNGGNPFLSFGPSLTLTADAVSRELMAPTTVRQLAARGFTASYAVALPTYTTSTTGSVLLVTAAGPNAAGVQRTLLAVTAQISTQLAQLQNGVPARGQVHAETLSVTPQAALSISQTARPLVAIGVLLLVICLGAPIVVDGLITRRRLRYRSALPQTPRRSLISRVSFLASRASLISRVFLHRPALGEEPTFPEEQTFPEEPTFPEEQTFPGATMGRPDPRAGDDAAATAARHARRTYW
jgi:hypothetical protein